MSILLQFVHPFPHQSLVNRGLVEALAAATEVRVNDLYALYPDLHIDIAREQRLLLQAELVVFQHPLYWYSAPALLKEWLDVVLESGFAYGDGGDALHGKRWLHSVTTGMPAHAYTATGANRATMDDLLRPFQLTAEFCGMQWLPPLVFHGAHSAAPAEIARHADRLKSCIDQGTV